MLTRTKRRPPLDASPVKEIEMREISSSSVTETAVKVVDHPKKKAKTATTSAKQTKNTSSSSSSLSTTTLHGKSRPILLDLGILVQGEVLARPSTQIKSPYVADIRITQDSLIDATTRYLAHAPSLDCCGMVVSGSTVYLSKNVKGKTQYAIQLCEDFLQKHEISRQETQIKLHNDTEITTTSTLIQSRQTYTKVGYHPQLAETLSKKLLSSGELNAFLGGSFDLAGSQVTLGDSRVDFLLQDKHHVNKKMIVEVKNVVCAEYDLIGDTCVSNHCKSSSSTNPTTALTVVEEGTSSKETVNHTTTPSTPKKSKKDNHSGTPNNATVTPTKTIGKVKLYERLTSDVEYVNLSPPEVPGLAPGAIPSRCALFPQGSKKAGLGVVSERAIKHIHNIIDLCSTQKKVSSPMKHPTGKEEIDYEGLLLFVVNRQDCDAYRPCHEACLLFSQSLVKAYQHGIKLLAVEIIWEEEEESKHMVARRGRILPVIVPKHIVDMPIDEEHLERVLAFATSTSASQDKE